MAWPVAKKKEKRTGGGCTVNRGRRLPQLGANGGGPEKEEASVDWGEMETRVAGEGRVLRILRRKKCLRFSCKLLVDSVRGSGVMRIHKQIQIQILGQRADGLPILNTSPTTVAVLYTATPTWTWTVCGQMRLPSQCSPPSSLNSTTGYQIVT